MYFLFPSLRLLKFVRHYLDCLWFDQRDLPFPVWESSAGLRLPCAIHGNDAERIIYGGWLKTPEILTGLCTKVHEILGRRIADPLYFQMPLPDCLSLVSLKRYLALKILVVEKLNKWEFFGPHFWEGRPRLFYDRLLARFTVQRLAKFG